MPLLFQGPGSQGRVRALDLSSGADARRCAHRLVMSPVVRPPSVLGTCQLPGCISPPHHSAWLTPSSSPEPRASAPLHGCLLEPGTTGGRGGVGSCLRQGLCPGNPPELPGLGSGGPPEPIPSLSSAGTGPWLGTQIPSEGTASEASIQQGHSRARTMRPTEGDGGSEGESSGASVNTDLRSAESQPGHRPGPCLSR